MELKDYKFPADLTGEIRTLSNQMQSTPEETIYMCLRMYFSLPVPERFQKWNIESWRVSQVDIIRD